MPCVTGCPHRHTNYLAYVKEGSQGSGYLNAAAVYRVNRWVCRIHCDKVVKLSDAVQKLPHQVIPRLGGGGDPGGGGLNVVMELYVWV